VSVLPDFVIYSTQISSSSKVEHMENEPQSAPQREIVVDSDWISGLAMTLLLVIALAFALQDWKLLAHGIVAQPVTLYTVLGAGYLFYVAISVSERLFRVAAFIAGLGAAVRALAFYLHGSDEVQRLAAINGLVLSLFASAMLVIGVAQWLRRVTRVQYR
jgi:hypothetical protein